MSFQASRIALLGSMVLILLSPAHPSAEICRVFFDMQTMNRHVLGEVNEECPPSWHSAGWGNWGVSSNFGDLANAWQFPGWTVKDNQLQWNSCTQDHIRDTDNIWYNHDHNDNGLGDDQFSIPNPVHSYADGVADFFTDCPYDSDDDGLCDEGGCLSLSNGVTLSDHFLSLYELDWPDGDDFITTLYIDSGCCTVIPPWCNPLSCEGGDSSWWPTSSYTNTEVRADVRMRMNFGAFVDNYGTCEWLAESDPRYNCS